jgi:hypothetical protein
MASRRYVNFGEVEESRVRRYRIDIVIEPDQNVGRAELVTAKFDKRPRLEHYKRRKVAQLFDDIPRIDEGGRRTRHRDPQPST